MTEGERKITTDVDTASATISCCMGANIYGGKYWFSEHDDQLAESVRWLLDDPVFYQKQHTRPEAGMHLEVRLQRDREMCLVRYKNNRTQCLQLLRFDATHVQFKFVWPESTGWGTTTFLLDDDASELPHALATDGGTQWNRLLLNNSARGQHLSHGRNLSAAFPVKIYLGFGKKYFKEGSEGKSFPGKMSSLLDVLKHPSYQSVFDGFQTIALIYNNTLDKIDFQKFHFGKDDVEKFLFDIEDEMYKVAHHLLSGNCGEGKYFILQNWEGDNLAKLHKLSKDDATKKDMVVTHMMWWFAARQRGVARARRDVERHCSVVLHAVEVNKVAARAKGEKKFCLAGDMLGLLPALDAVSYSFWEWGDKTDLGVGEKSLKLCVPFLREQFKHQSDYGKMHMPGGVYIGEFGAHWGRQVRAIEHFRQVFQELNVPLAFFWNCYNNSTGNNPDKQDYRRYCLRDRKGRECPTLDAIVSSATSTQVRVFDLGGSGLKTATCICFSDNSLEMSQVQNLERVPVDKRVYEWVRKIIPSFSAEKNGGVFKFGASLAGLDKLWEDKTVHEQDTPSFEQLIRAGTSSGGPGVARLSDGTAHLKASKLMMKLANDATYPLCNIALGTGIAIKLTNSKGEIRIDDEMTQFFGTEEHWNFRVDCEGREKPMYKAFGGDFDGARGNTARQTARWVRFIEGRLAERFTVMGWTLPVCYTFTGGVAEKSSLVAKLQEQGLPIRKGPHNAGLLGAALAALGH